MAFGDYCDMNGKNDFGDAYQCLPLTRNENSIIKFIKNTKDTCGGDGDEFYELVIKKIVERLFEGIAANDIEQAKNSLQELGYAGEIYGRSAAEFADEVIAAARSGLSDNERGFLEPLEKLVAARTTLADRE